MTRLYIFNFDGTCNSPDDAVQEVSKNGQVEDDNITNIVKFHLLCGGSLAEQRKGWNTTQHCFYYAGVGTYGSRLQKALNTIFSPEGSDVRNILRRHNELDSIDGLEKIDIRHFDSEAYLQKWPSCPNHTNLPTGFDSGG